MSTVLKTTNFNGYNGSHFVLTLEYDILNQDVTNITTNIRYTLKMTSKDGYSGSGSASNGYINGSWVGSFTSIGVNTTIVVGTKDESIRHNEDGTKSVDYSASISSSWNGLGSASVSGTLQLPTINRTSTINSFVGNDLSGNFSATYTNYVSSYKQKLRISIPNVVSLMTIDNYVSGTGVTLDTASLNTIKQYMDTNHTNKIILGGVIETWDGSTKIGESTELKNECSFIDGQPTFTYTTTEINTNVSNILGTSANTIIQNASIVRIAVTPTAKYGATISKVTVTHNNQSYEDTTSPYSLDIPITRNNFVIEVQDNRGNKTSQTITRTMIEYIPVDIETFYFERYSPTSSNVILNLEATYYQKNFGSTANAPTVKWKLENGSYVTIPSTEYSIDTTNNKLTITNYELTNVLPYTSQGQFTIYIEDLLTNDTDGGNNGKVTKGIPTFDYGESDFQVNGDLYVADTERQNKVNVLEECLDKYSTSEIVVGKWIDNKPIYRRVITFTNISYDSGYTYNTGITSSILDTLIKIQGTYKGPNSCSSIPRGHPNLNSWENNAYLQNDGLLVLEMGSSYTNISEAIVILEYTKTTD